MIRGKRDLNWFELVCFFLLTPWSMGFKRNDIFHTLVSHNLSSTQSKLLILPVFFSFVLCLFSYIRWVSPSVAAMSSPVAASAPQDVSDITREFPQLNIDQSATPNEIQNPEPQPPVVQPVGRGFILPERTRLDFSACLLCVQWVALDANLGREIELSKWSFQK